MKYPTVRAIVQMYKSNGCVNKFLNRYEKKQLLKRRQLSQRFMSSDKKEQRVKPSCPLKLNSIFDEKKLESKATNDMLDLSKPDCA